MEVHKPKPWHGWREFLKEYLIIVVGVLTALAAEQAVEWLHWRTQVAEFRTAVRQELAYDLATYQYRVGENGCVKARLDDLERWHASWRAGRPNALTRPIGVPDSFSLETSVWQTRDANIASHMAPEERMALGRLYDRFENNEIHRLDERQTWLELAQFDGATSLDQAALMRLRSLITRARYRDSHMTANSAGYFEMAKKIGVKPEVQDFGKETGRSFCGSILDAPREKTR